MKHRILVPIALLRAAYIASKEEADSAPVLHPVLSHKTAKQITFRLALQQFTSVGQYIVDAVTSEEWQRTLDEHAAYLKANPIYWIHTTFFGEEK